MKITKTLVKHFEIEQKEFGTKIAISNLLWLVAEEILLDLGVRNIKTVYEEDQQVQYERDIKKT